MIQAKINQRTSSTTLRMITRIEPCNVKRHCHSPISIVCGKADVCDRALTVSQCRSLSHSHRLALDRAMPCSAGTPPARSPPCRAPAMSNVRFSAHYGLKSDIGRGRFVPQAVSSRVIRSPGQRGRSAWAVAQDRLPSRP